LTPGAKPSSQDPCTNRLQGARTKAEAKAAAIRERLDRVQDKALKAIKEEDLDFEGGIDADGQIHNGFSIKTVVSSVRKAPGKGREIPEQAGGLATELTERRRKVGKPKRPHEDAMEDEDRWGDEDADLLRDTHMGRLMPNLPAGEAAKPTVGKGRRNVGWLKKMKRDQAEENLHTPGENALNNNNQPATTPAAKTQSKHQKTEAPTGMEVADMTSLPARRSTRLGIAYKE